MKAGWTQILFTTKNAKGAKNAVTSEFFNGRKLRERRTAEADFLATDCTDMHGWGRAPDPSALKLLNSPHL
jgi:hypothetical protein